MKSQKNTQDVKPVSKKIASGKNTKRGSSRTRAPTERQLFEAHIKTIDRSNCKERLHKSRWWDGNNTLMYSDPWTRGLWVGWCMKAGVNTGEEND